MPISGTFILLDSQGNEWTSTLATVDTVDMPVAVHSVLGTWPMDNLVAEFGHVTIVGFHYDNEEMS